MLVSVALLAVGATHIVSSKNELSRKEQLQVNAWIDWQLSVSDDLPKTRQAGWMHVSEESPETMMRACSFVIEPTEASKK